MIPRCLFSRRSARKESNLRLALIRSLLSPLSYEPSVFPSRFFRSGAGRGRTLACQIKSLLCCRYTTTPEPIRGQRFNRRVVISALRFRKPVARGGVEPPLPPYQSDMLPLQHRAANRGGQNRTALSRAPDARGSPLPFTPQVRTAGFEPAVSWPPARRISTLSHVLNSK